MGLDLYQMIHQCNVRWSETLENERAPFNWDTAEAFARAYRWWLENARWVLQGIIDCERQGYDVERAEEFRQIIQDVSLLPLDVASVRRNLEAVQRGEGISIEQALDEL